MGKTRKARKKPDIAVRSLVLHEAGYLCANPKCRHVITLDVHHLDHVCDGGSNAAENLLALCPNCHALHHAGKIPTTSLRAWKQLLLAINEAFDRKSVDVLLSLHKLTAIRRVTGDGVISVAPLVAAGLVDVKEYTHTRNGLHAGQQEPMYCVQLSDKGTLFIEGWKKGDQNALKNTLLTYAATNAPHTKKERATTSNS